MRETPLSLCERNFISKSISEGVRLDGRSLLDPRPVQIHFGANWGCCLVALGETKAVAQVSCDILEPKASRPNEGMLHINVELNPLAAQYFEAGRQSEAAVLINRQLEKCFKDSRCIDLESLCIVADKKVWNLRVDINIINHDGNLLDCASIATLAAISHFHRPDVTSTGDGVVIHSFAEKDPLPITLHHYPVCVSFIVFGSGETVMDATYIEERVGAAQLSLGINSYRELCSLHLGYSTKTPVVSDVVSTVSTHAANYANKLVQQIKEAVQKDVQARYNKTEVDMCRFKDCLAYNRTMAMARERLSIKLPKWKVKEWKEDDENQMEEDHFEDNKIINMGEGSAELLTNEHKKLIGEGGQSTWQASESSEDEDVEDVQLVDIVKPQKNVLDDIELSGDSEEEHTGTLTTADIMSE